MTQSPSAKLPKIPPKWAIFAFLIGALCVFAAAFMAFIHNGPVAMTLALIGLALYLAGAIGYGLAPRRQPGTPKAMQSTP